MNVAAFITAAESLGPDSLEALLNFYAEDCRFTDPFQTVYGRSNIRRVYQDMFSHLYQPQFKNVELMAQPDHAKSELVISWCFEFSIGHQKPRQQVLGCSRLRLDGQGKILDHQDFWDGSQLMQAFPIVGPVIRWLRQKIGHPKDH